MNERTSVFTDEERAVIFAMGRQEDAIAAAWRHFDSRVRSRPGAQGPRQEREAFFSACRQLMRTLP